MVDLHTDEVEYNPFEDGGSVIVSYNEILSQFVIRSKMPSGIVERGESGEMNENDFAFISWMIDEYTNWDFNDRILSGENEMKLAYVVELIISTIIGREPTSWEEFGDEGFNFTENESLGVR